MLTQFLTGANMLGFLVAGLFFLHFWRRTHDRFFAIFAAAFWVMACERVILALLHSQNEISPAVYLVRLFAFLLIIFAIVEKNRSEKN